METSIQWSSGKPDIIYFVMRAQFEHTSAHNWIENLEYYYTLKLLALITWSRKVHADSLTFKFKFSQDIVMEKALLLVLNCSLRIQTEEFSLCSRNRRYRWCTVCLMHFCAYRVIKTANTLRERPSEFPTIILTVVVITKDFFPRKLFLQNTRMFCNLDDTNLPAHKYFKELHWPNYAIRY